MITVNYLAHCANSIDILKKYFLQSNSTDKFEFNLLCSKAVEQYIKENSKGLPIRTLITFPNDFNYMHKIYFALGYSDEYAIKLDDDIIIPPYLWDMMYENLEYLESAKILSPILTTGIPSVELFIREYCTKEERERICSLFLQTEIPNNGGINPIYHGTEYRDKLNQHTVNAEVWDGTEFFNSVKTIDHYYKGVHPVRINVEIQKEINKIILNDYKRFLNYNIQRRISSASIYHERIGFPEYYYPFSAPYFCNSMFMIKTELWNEIISRKDLFRDGFDEVPLNLYWEEKGWDWKFINGVAIHPYYNSIGHKIDLENEVFDAIRLLDHSL